MKNFQKFLSYVLVAIVASAVTLAVYGNDGAAEYDKLDEVRSIVDECFIDEVDHEAMEDAAAAAMIAALGDRWSGYMTASDYEIYMEQMNNAYVGIGITISAAEDETGLEVLQVNPKGPADLAGMVVGDVIVAVEGQVVADMTLSEAKALVRGEEGTQVKITVLRGEEKVELSVTRAMIETPVVKAQMLEHNIGLIRIYNFDERCADETCGAIESLLEQNAQALIFDVRHNPGGYRKEMVEVLDYILPEGPLFHSEDYTGRVSVDQSDASCLSIPMAVLVNQDSYSAAEFFAAALEEYDAATVVGTKTVGKGHFQYTFDLLDGSAITISTGRYTTPKGVSLTDVGITPEVYVEVDEETAARIYAETLPPEEDPQIQAAVKVLLGS